MIGQASQASSEIKYRIFTAGSGSVRRASAVRSLGHRAGEGSWRRALEWERDRVWGVVMAKVYVSSTIADLTEERRAVLDWLRLARHQAVDSYLPDSDTVRDSCLDDVGTCDLYVLILGHRYGSPAGRRTIRRACRSLIWSSGGPVSAVSRGWRCCAPASPTCACRICRTRPGRRWCSGSAMRWPGQVRAAEFSDLQGLIQGLSTGIQSELDKLDKREERQAGPVAAGRALRLAPRPVFLAGREELLAELEARLAGR